MHGNVLERVARITKSGNGVKLHVFSIHDS